MAIIPTFPMRCSFQSTQNDLPGLAIEPPAILGWPMVEVAEFRVIFNRSSIPS